MPWLGISVFKFGPALRQNRAKRGLFGAGPNRWYVHKAIDVSKVNNGGGFGGRCRQALPVL
jgi:hypothetical protein